MSPPFPPFPPAGPPLSTYFSLLQATAPFPPLPDKIFILDLSKNAALVFVPVLIIKQTWLFRINQHFYVTKSQNDF